MSKSPRNFVRAFMASALGTGLSRILGAARDIALAAFLGAGATSDAFFVAWTVPNTFRRFVADEGLTGAMIPALSEAEAEGEDPKRLASTILTALLLANLVLCVLGILGAETVVTVFAPKWRDQPEQFALAVTMTRWLFPFLAMVSLVSFYEGLLNQRGHFFIPKLAPGLVSGGIVIALLGFGGASDEPAFVAVGGVLVGGLVHVGVNLPVTIQRWGMVWPGGGLGDPRFRRVLTEIGKVVLIGIFAQINIIVLRQIATSLETGSVTWYHNGTRVVDLAQGVIAVAIGSALLPTVSQAVAEQDWERLRIDLVRAVRLACFLLFPAGAVLVMFAEPITSTLFRLGAFTARDMSQTASIVALLLPYMLAVAGLQIYKKVFFALNDRASLLKVGGFGVLLTAALGWTLTASNGVVGLAAALSCSTLVQLVLYLWILRRRLGTHLGLGELAQPLGQMVLATGPVWGVLWLVKPWGQWELGPMHLPNLATLGVGLGVSAGLYLLLAYLLGLSELDVVLRRKRGA